MFDAIENVQDTMESEIEIRNLVLNLHENMMQTIVNFHPLRFGYSCPIIIEILNCDMRLM